MRRMLATAVLVLTAAGVVCAQAQDAGAALVADQTRTQERMVEVEQRLLALARLLAQDQPGRAARLADALALSRERFIVDTMAAARRMLADGRLAEAARLQEQASSDLARLVALLGASDAPEELQRLRALEAALVDLLARQARLGAAAGPADAQEAVRADAEAVLARMRGGPGAAPMAAAVDSMARAERALRANDGGAAGDAQADAQRSLGEALGAVRASIAALAAQQRSAAHARIARLLSAMAADQKSILADTRAAAAALAESPDDRAAQLAVSRLAEREADVAARADEALALAREKGGAALPAALEGVGADVALCRRRLAEGQAGPAVQRLQEGIIGELEALLEALGGGDRAMVGDLEPGEPGQDAQRRRRPADVAGELRVVRAVQTAVQARTARLDELRQAGEASPLDAEAAALGERQAGVTAMVGAVRQAGTPALAWRLAPVGEGSALAGELLRRGLTGQQVQQAQQRVVDGLDALIAALERQAVLTASASSEASESRSQRTGVASGPPVRPADESMHSPFGPAPGRIAEEGPAAAAWLPDLPEAERKKVSDAFRTGRLPARYRDLLRDYSRRLAAQDE